MPYKRIRVRGVRQEEIDADKLALAFWLMGKRRVEEKRRLAAEQKQAGAGAGRNLEDRTSAGR